MTSCLPAMYHRSSTRPAVEDRGTDLLVGRLPVPRVDLAVHGLHPARILVDPRLHLSDLRNERRQMSHLRRHRAEEVHVGAKVLVAALERRRHARLAGQQRRVGAVRVGVQRKTVTVIRPQNRQNIMKILNPVAIGIARVDGLRVPRGDGADQHQVILVAGQPVYGIAAEAIAARIQLWGNHLAGADDGAACGAHLARVVGQGIEAHGQAAPRRVGFGGRTAPLRRVARPVDLDAGPLDRVVHLVADDPDARSRGWCRQSWRRGGQRLRTGCCAGWCRRARSRD